MEYKTNSHAYGLNKRVKSFLHHVALLAILHSSFVAPAQGIIDAYIHNKKPVPYSGNGYSAPEANTVTDVQSESAHVYPKYVKTIKSPRGFGYSKAAMSYAVSADIKEGVIGVSKEKPLDSPADNLFKVNLTQLPTNRDKAYLTYEVYGVADHQSVARSINDRLSVGGYLIKKQQGWSVQKEEIDPAWLALGENTVLFTIAQGADYQYRVRNLSIAIEKNDKMNPLLTVHTNLLPISKDNKIYVKGFIRGNHANTKIEAGGTFLQIYGNEFEGYIQLTDEIKKTQILPIKAFDGNELLGQELLFIDNRTEADRLLPFERKTETRAKMFEACKGERLDIGGASLITDDSTLDMNYDLSITRLRNIDIAPLESGMINVTKGGSGYRFLPDGTTFDTPVRLSIDYDEKLLPSGYSTEDIKTFYFDKGSKRWIAVQKDSIDSKNKAIISKTTHFTDYINGIIQSPDSPETTAFTPTMMSDVKAADPSAEITLISPPSASQKGDANISFPFRLPAGRNGMQPQVGLQYSNEGGSSWVGTGWSLNIPAITIDTRWGSPLFDPALESESYLLSGEQLMYPDNYMPNRHRENGSTIITDLIPRYTGNSTIFTPRKQGSFAKVERLGNSPSTYYWKITDTDGTIYWYGGKEGDANAPTPNPNAIIKNAGNNIVHWALYKVEDVYGNNIIYEYYNAALSSVQNTVDQNLVGGRFFYPKDIFYTGFNNDKGSYHIEFRRSGQIRNDATINARLGLKQIDPYQLSEVFISYQQQPNGDIVPIRSYMLNYATGKFGKNHLYSIMEGDGDSHGYKYVHSFDYYDDIRKDDTDVYFAAGIDVSICNDNYEPCPDDDRDGICNEFDLCPYEAGPIETQGCPEGKCYIAKIPITSALLSVYISVNGIALGSQPYDLINNLGAFISDFQAVWGANAQIQVIDGAINIQVEVAGGMSYIQVGVNQYTFFDCTQPKPAKKGAASQRVFRLNENDYQISLTAPLGDPDCQDFLNINYLFDGSTASFNSSASILGSSASSSGSTGFYVGMGVGSNPITKMTTLGWQYNEGSDSSEAITSSIDINGDGLEDLVIKENGKLFYKPHTIERTYDEHNEPVITHTFGNKLPIAGMDNFYRSYGSSGDSNFQLTAGFSSIGGFIGKNNASSYSETDMFFTDANGDGLPDIVKDGMVYFNRLDINGNPVFSPDSKLTENMVITAKERQVELPPLALQTDYPGYDVVKVWEAPNNGAIKIINDIQLTNSAQESTVTIEMQKKEASCYKVSFAAPTTEQTKYVYRVGQKYVYIGWPNAGNCIANFWSRIVSLKINSSLYTAENNLFVAHGDITGAFDQCPSSSVYAYPNCFSTGSPVCEQIKSSDYMDRAEPWFSGIMSNYNDILDYTLNNRSGLQYITTDPNSPDYLNLYNSNCHLFQFSSFNANYTFEEKRIDRNHNNTSTTAVTENDPPISTPSTVGLDVNVSVDGVPMAQAYNLYAFFNIFKTAFEGQFPGTTVTKSGNTITIQYSGITPLFNTVTITPVTGGSQNYNFADCSTSPRPATVNSFKANIPSIQEGRISLLKEYADGKELTEPIQDVGLAVVLDLTNANIEESLRGNYLLKIFDGAKTLFDNNERIVTSPEVLNILDKFIPKGIDSIYANIQKINKEQELLLRKEHQQKASEKLKAIENEYRDKLSAKNPQQFTTMSSGSGCNSQPREICLLFGAILNSGTPTISNVITTSNIECNPGGGNLFVNKGDRIYFRVHSNNNTENPAINWNPRVEYTDPALLAVTDANGITPYASSYSDGFILSSNQGTIFPGTSGTALITWPSFTVTPNDHTQYQIFRRIVQSNGTGDPTITWDLNPVYDLLCNANTTTTVPAGNISVTVTAPTGGGVSHTEFYFRVITASNIKWKESEWRPKMQCTVSQPITGDNGSNEGNMEVTQTVYPIPDYNIYKPYSCAVPYSRFDAGPYNGGVGVTIYPTLNGIFDSDDNGIVNFVIKKGTQYVGRNMISIVNGNVASSIIPMALLGNGNDYELSYSVQQSSASISQDASMIDKLAQTSNAIATISWGSTTVDIPKSSINLLHKTDGRFGPMYRGWGQFMYNPDNVTGAVSSPYGNLINEDVLTVSEETGNLIQDILANADNINPNSSPEDVEAILDNMMAAYGNLASATAFLPANPDRTYINGGYDDKWAGCHSENYASPGSCRAAEITESGSGFGGDFYLEQDVIKTGAYSISKCNDGNSKNFSGGANAFGGGFAATRTKDGIGNNLTDYVDFNGDRYPDIVSQTKVQVTNPTGGLLEWEGRLGNISSSTSDGTGRTASGSYSKGGDESGEPAAVGNGFQRFEGYSGSAGAGLSGTLSNSNSKTIEAWMDINGDGLADHLKRDGSNLKVGLNYGNKSTTITDEASWGDYQIFNNAGKGSSAGVGVNLWNGSFEAGVSVMKNTGGTRSTVVDMNGDGLLDFVSTPTITDFEFNNQVDVRINTGNKFYTMNDWADYNLANESETVSSAINAGFSYALVWGILGLSIKIPAFGFNGVVKSTATNKTKKSITDYDGDGYPDLVEVTSNNTVKVRSSNIRRTGMLKSVTNPLGGKFTVDYKVITPTYDNPNPKWVMTELIVEDGYDLEGDGVDKYRKSFEYEKGRYDRREREFYGFEKVKTIDYNYDSEGLPVSVYRTNVATYHNRSYFLNGLIKESYVIKGADETKLFSKSNNTYVIYGLNSNGTINFNDAKPLTFDVGGQEGRKQAAVLLTRTQSYLYELANNPLYTEATMKYDEYGNVKEYKNFGAAGAADDYTATIKYHDDAALLSKNMLRIPEVITVFKTQGNTALRKRATTVNPATGDIERVTVNLNSSEEANTDMQYDQYGNLALITYPPNQAGQSMYYMYTYDSIDHKYVVGIEDAFGYQSSSTYDKRFDKVLTSTDISGNTVINKYDGFGRLTSVTSPKEIEAGAVYTMTFTYYPTLLDIPAGQSCLDSNELFMPYAITRHFDEQHPGNDIETVTIMDGLARPVQVKKDIEMNMGSPASPVYEERMSVSGIVEYDAFGRPFKQFNPWHEAKLCNVNSVFSYYDTSEYSKTNYDEMDRPVLTVDQEENYAEISYAIAPDKLGAPSFRTATSVQNNSDPILTEVFKDITGKVTYTKNILTGNAAEDIWTEFTYDAIGQMIAYTDAKGLSSTYVYDLGGRRIENVHPDKGKTTYVYDLSGNLIKLQTANLLADTSLAPQDQYIKYNYHYNRILSIIYPPMPYNDNLSNVYYEYGEFDNDKGRLLHRIDASGEMYFMYDSMGQISGTKRLVVGPNIPTRLYYFYYNYDSWNRLTSMTYADQELVQYSYDLGGNLKTISGTVNGDPYDYVRQIDYDHFEQKSYIKYGNNTETTYQYTAGLRRFHLLDAKTASGEAFIAKSYEYDNVGNITKIINSTVPNTVNGMGGSTLNTYTYDNMNRLISSQGTFTGDGNTQGPLNNDYSSAYSLEMEYNNVHSITKKTQNHYKNGQQAADTSMMSIYTYPQDSHRLQVFDNQLTGSVNQYVYDNNGNIKYEIDPSLGTSRMHNWDESDRLRAITDDYSMQHYIYDATGERTLKGSANPKLLYNNGIPVSGDMIFSTYVTYPNQYMVVNGDGKFSKHYYAGSQRVVSRVSDEDASMFEVVTRPATPTGSGSEKNDKKVFSEDKLRKMQISDLALILSKAEKGPPVFKKYKPEDEEEGEDMKETGENDNEIDSGDKAVQTNSGPETNMLPPVAALYFYHPDHLGSSTYLTDANGELYQFFLNLPFGETMAEQHSLTQDYVTPFKFNGKELDSETGLYYYGARYYNPKTSIWLSVDPLAIYNPVTEDEFYGDGQHNGGIYNNKNINVYGYCYGNPIVLIDPNGKQIYFMTPPSDLSPEGANIIADITPVVGDVKGVAEGLIGYNILGEELSYLDRSMSLMCLSEVKAVRTTYKLIDKANDIRKILKPLWGIKHKYKGIAKLQTAMEHIKMGHFYNARNGLKTSRFSQALSNVGSVKKLVNTAVAKGKHTVNREGQHSITYTFDKIIGTDSNGRSTKTIQVYLDNAGNVLNAYPITKSK